MSEARMIETTVPDIDVTELMTRVRAEAAKPKPVRPSRTAPAVAAPALPAVALLPAAPNVWIPGAVKSNKERLERLVQTAREKNDGGFRLPKFLRRFFRKQGGYNRAIVDGVAALSRSNQELTQRVADITVCLGQLNSWLLALHEQSDSDAHWMKAAAPVISKIDTVKGELDFIGQGLQSMDASLHELHRDQVNAREKIDAVASSATESAFALRDAVKSLRQETIEKTNAVAAALKQSEERNGVLRDDFERAGAHLRNLQFQTDGLGQQLAGLKDESARRAGKSDAKEDDLQQQVDQVGLHLRNLQAQTDRLGVHINNLQGFVDKQTAEANAIHRGLEQRCNDQAGLAQRLSVFEDRTTADAAFVKGQLSEYGTLLRQLPEAELPGNGEGKKRAARSEPMSVPGADSFYVAFENRFRGTRGEIKKRVEFYLPFVRGCRAGDAGRPILDVGCGRGEWLELLEEQKLEGKGVDMNGAMIAQCKARGFNVELGDALEYLASLRANSQGAVTGFHIIEHLSFEMLLDLFRQARRVLKPGGVAIFESPNCKNLIVGACNFHIDPTHCHPVFPETAELMLAAQGFEKIRIEYLSPVPDVKFADNTPELATIRELLYGPQDFGIIAYKPKAR